MYNIPYLLVLLIPFYYLIRTEKYNAKSTLKIIFLVYFVFASIRGNGSGDYFNYINAVPLIDSFKKLLSPGEYPFEFGFRIISLINNKLLLPPQFTISVLNGISLFNIYYIIDKYSTRKVLSAFLYFSFLLIFDMHHTRSAVAMSFVLQFAFALRGNNYRNAIIFSLMSLIFHKSSFIPIAFIVLIFYLNRGSESKNRRNYSLIFLVILYFISATFKISELVKYFVMWLPDISIKIKFLSYLSNDRWTYPFSIIDPRLILLFVTYYLAHLIDFKKSELFNFLKKMTFMGLLIIFLLRDSTMLVMRFYNFFNLFTIFFIPMILDEYEKIMNERKYLVLYYSLIFIYMVYFIALSFRQVPYYLFF